MSIYMAIAAACYLGAVAVSIWMGYRIGETRGVNIGLRLALKISDDEDDFSDENFERLLKEAKADEKKGAEI